MAKKLIWKNDFLWALSHFHQLMAYTANALFFPLCWYYRLGVTNITTLGLVHRKLIHEKKGGND
jgi:hypothetical protein